MINDFISKIIIKKTNNGFIQFVRYGLVSVIALAVDFGGMVLLVELFSIHYLVAATVSFISGLVVNYLLSRAWVFTERKYESRVKEFIIFTGIGIVGLLLNNSIMWLAVEKIGIYYIFSKIIATILVFFWNFGLRKMLVFKQVKTEGVE
jgi:putative flippase GtrA